LEEEEKEEVLLPQKPQTGQVHESMQRGNGLVIGKRNSIPRDLFKQEDSIQSNEFYKANSPVEA